jgi:hypothetical protein
MKSCSKCKAERPLDEFSKHAKEKDGLYSQCKECARQSAKARYSPEKYKLRKFITKVRNCNQCGAPYQGDRCKPCRKKYQAKYALENAEKARKKVAAWRAADPDRARESWARSYVLNAEKRRKSASVYRAANADRRRIWEQNREAKKRLGGTLSVDLMERLFRLQKGKCACCGEPLGANFNIDHIMPLALGGENTDNNIQLLRKLCNQRKHAKHPVAYMRERGFLL